MNTFNVEEYVENYEFRSDDGDYSPDENEKGMLIDAIHGAISEICLSASDSWTLRRVAALKVEAK